MPGARLIRMILALALLAVVGGCTTIAPVTTAGPSGSPTDTSSPSASSLVPTGLPTASPSAVPTVEPTVAPPTDTPAATAKPTKTPKPTAAPGANLVVGKFEIVADAVVAEVPFDAIFIVRNTGTADAGAFQAAVLETHVDDGVKGESDPFSVDGGLAAGTSVEVTISMALPLEGHWTLTATADSGDDVAETSEDDNTRDATVNVLGGLPDLQWANGGLSMTPSQTNPGHYDTAYDFINKGTADYAGQTSFIKVTWYRDEDSASGDFPLVPVGDLAIDEERVLEQSLEFPGPGTYTVYAFIDTDRVVPETNEDNNEVQINVTVP